MVLRQTAPSVVENRPYAELSAHKTGTAHGAAKNDPPDGTHPLHHTHGRQPAKRAFIALHRRCGFTSPKRGKPEGLAEDRRYGSRLHLRRFMPGMCVPDFPRGPLYRLHSLLEQVGLILKSHFFTIRNSMLCCCRLTTTLVRGTNTALPR